MKQLFDDSLMETLLGQVTPAQMAQGQFPQQSQGQANPMSMMMQMLMSSQGQGIELPTGAALTNLSPEHIAQALQYKSQQEQLMQQRPSQLVDMMHKMNLAKESAARAADIPLDTELKRQALKAKSAVDPLDQPSKIQIPSMGYLTQRAFNALPSDVKGYAVYANQKASVDDESPISYEDWVQSTIGDKLKFLRQLNEPGNEPLKSLAIELAGDKSGAAAQAGQDIAQSGYFGSAAYSKDLRSMLDPDKLMFNPIYRQSMETTGDPTAATIDASFEIIESHIRASGGEIIDRKLNPDGTVTRTIKPKVGKEIKVTNEY